jgi:hypothetical protein
MRVALATHGGQAAALNLRLPPRVLDTDKLPPEAAEELRRLVAAASAENDGTSQPGSARDAMSYTITVDDDARSATLTGSDTAMSPSFGALLSWIEQHTTT